MANYIDQEVEGAFESMIDVTSTTSAQEIKAAVSGKNICITDITISTDTAQSVKITTTGGSVIIPRKFLPANGTWSKQYRTPKLVVESGAVNIICGGSSGNVTVELNGYVK